MPAIRLASHYLRRKPFSLSFLFFWMRGCEPLDSHSACMGRKITIRFSNTKTCSLDRFRLWSPSHSAFNTKHSVKRTIFFSTQSKRKRKALSQTAIWKVYGRIQVCLHKRLDSLLLDGSIRTVLFLTDNHAERSGPVQNTQKWSEVMWIVSFRMPRGTKNC